MRTQKDSIETKTNALRYFLHTLVKYLFRTDKITFALCWLLTLLRVGKHLHLPVSSLLQNFSHTHSLTYSLSHTHTHFPKHNRSILKGTLLRQHHRQLKYAHAHRGLQGPPPFLRWRRWRWNERRTKWKKSPAMCCRMRKFERCNFSLGMWEIQQRNNVNVMPRGN
jgi:hypothetical protein